MRRAFSLTELIIAIAIMAILAAVSFGLIVSTYQFLIFMPNQLNLLSAANEIIDTIIEGAAEGRPDEDPEYFVRNGLRYSVEIKDASGSQLTYIIGYPTNADKRMIRFKSVDNKVYKSYTDLGADLGTPPSYDDADLNSQVVPNDAAGVSVSGPEGSPSQIFTYYKAEGSGWEPLLDKLCDIRRVEINITVKVGSGKSINIYKAASGVDVRQYTSL